MSSPKIIFKTAFLFLTVALFMGHCYGQSIRINEVMSSNIDFISDEDGSFEDWIEIINTGNESINLEGYGLSDDYDNPFKWVFPAYEIQPGELMLIWASGKDRKPEPGSMQSGIIRKFFPGIPGTAVSDLTHHPSFPDQPASTSVLISSFEAPIDIDDNYGQMLYTWIAPPMTGNYKFWISSDDNSVLRLSSDESPENISTIASVPGWTHPREWYKFPQQTSAPVFLEEGQLYYMVALMKEGAGGDNLAVRWLMPDNVLEEPLNASHCRIPSARWHTNFSISAQGEELILTHPDGQRLDEMPPMPIPANISAGRLADSGNAWFLFDRPSPELPNPGEGFTDISEEPLISPASGVYASNTLVSITTNDLEAQIYYTINGNMPEPGSATLYTGPFMVNHTNYIRAVAVSPGKLQSPVAATIISVAADEIREFSSDLPLLILHSFNNPITPGGRTPAYMSLINNNQGVENHLVDPAEIGSRILINIRGTSSQTFPKKGYGFHSVEENDRNQKLPLLGMPEEHNWVLHGPYADKTLMRNAFSYSLGNDLGHYTPRTRFVELYLHEGYVQLRKQHYHGVYVLTERIKVAPGRVEIAEMETHHNYYPEVSGGYIFKNDRLNPGESGFTTSRGSLFAHVRPNEQSISNPQKSYLVAFIDSLEQALFGDQFTDPDQGYAAFMDVQSFTDMHLITELTKEIDGYRLSTFLHKDRQGKVKMGPLWDFNLSLGNVYYLQGWNPQGWYYTQISETEYMYGWYNRLFQDPHFYDQYRRRYRSLRLTAFSEANLIGKAMQFYDQLHQARARNFEKWKVLGTWVWPNYFIGQTWDEEVFWMTNWIKQRLEWMDSQLGQPYSMIHYWNFNQEDLLQPTFTLADASLQVNAGIQAEVSPGTGQDFNGINARNGDGAAQHLRINNPAGTELIFALPSTQYQNLLFSYETRRSANGANRQIVSYTFDGENYHVLDTLTVIEKPVLHHFDFSHIAEVNDNDNFSVKIWIEQTEDGSGGITGNNRFDNVSLDGEALEGVNRPPVLIKWFPENIELIAQNPAYILDLSTYFSDPDGDLMQYTLVAPQGQFVNISKNTHELTIQPLKAGSGKLKILATDGTHPPLTISANILVYPDAVLLQTGNYLFDYWDPNEPEGSFPEHMIFLQSEQDDPDLGTPSLHAYNIPAADYASGDQGNIGFPYRNQSRTRINGMGADGISFINTGRGRDLGVALLAINTENAQNVTLSWKASTIRANSRAYHFRLQYRVGYQGLWKNWTHEAGYPIEYVRAPVAGHQTFFEDLELPPDARNKPYVQIRWVYYYTGIQLNENSGARDMLAVNSIQVKSLQTGVETEGQHQHQSTLTAFPNPTTHGRLYLSQKASGSLYDITGIMIARLDDVTSINTHGLSNGIYFFRSDSGETIRFIVSR